MVLIFCWSNPLKFHKYENSERTPFEEHLVEGAAYAKDGQGKVRLHFTVSPEHQTGFEDLLKEILNNNALSKELENYKISKTATFTYFSLTPGKDFTLTNSFHEKIFLVDGEVAIIGGRNISDSSLNGKDLEVLMPISFS